MTLLYYLCFGLVLVVAGPFLLLQKKARAGLWQKLGFVPGAIKAKKNQLSGCVWFHAVSVGEFNAVTPLIKAFHAKYPTVPIVVSTTTYTGQKLAQEKISDIASVIYFPYDLPFATSAYLDLLKPRLVVIAETEIWPGFCRECKNRKIKLVVVNGRISPRSFKSYFRYRAFFGPVLRLFDEIGVQSKEEAERYSKIASGGAKIRVLGNLKFDGLQPVSLENSEKLRAAINLPADRFTLVAGSTHEGEELAMLKAYGRMLDINGGAAASTTRLILVPRHPERFDHVAALIDQNGYKVRRYSRNEIFDDSGREVYLLDVIGKLFDFYSLATVAFVGGTIAPIGGHNIMEPYAYEVPVAVGPHIEKTRDVADALVARQAIVIGADADAVIERLVHYFTNAESRRIDGLAGSEILKGSQGALAKAMDMLGEHLNNSSNEHQQSILTRSKR